MGAAVGVHLQPTTQMKEKDADKYRCATPSVAARLVHLSPLESGKEIKLCICCRSCLELSSSQSVAACLSTERRTEDPRRTPPASQRSRSLLHTSHFYPRRRKMKTLLDIFTDRHKAGSLWRPGLIHYEIIREYLFDPSQILSLSDTKFEEMKSLLF